MLPCKLCPYYVKVNNLTLCIAPRYPVTKAIVDKSFHTYCTINVLTCYSYANLLALLITLIYILSGSFRTLLTFVGMASWVFYVSTVVGLLILRRREAELHRPYKPPMILPVTFVIVGTFIIVRSAIFAPVQAGVLACLLIIGTLVSRVRSS